MFLCTCFPIIDFDEIVYCCPLLKVIHDDDKVSARYLDVDTEILKHTRQNGND